jgi:hypothetical protein
MVFSVSGTPPATDQGPDLRRFSPGGEVLPGAPHLLRLRSPRTDSPPESSSHRNGARHDAQHPQPGLLNPFRIAGHPDPSSASRRRLVTPAVAPPPMVVGASPGRPEGVPRPLNNHRVFARPQAVAAFRRERARKVRAVKPKWPELGDNRSDQANMCGGEARQSRVSHDPARRVA